jgi:phosphate transport system protein
MRDAYHDDLDAITAKLTQMASLAGSMIGRATTALLDADLELAERVITADEQVDLLYREVEELAYDVMARQQPVAGDLRLLVTSLRMVHDLERMGDLALHVGKLARMRYPQRAIPAELRSLVLEMGQTAQRIVEKAGSVVASRDVRTALELEHDDDIMDDYQRRLYTLLLDERRPYPTEVAIDVTLCGRYYERFCDHAVSVARRVVYLVTGQQASAMAALDAGRP